MSKADNKELEKAVEILKEIQETNKVWLKDTEEENCEKMYLRDIEAIETVLKELKRLQEENKYLKQANREKENKIIEIINLYQKSVLKDKVREKIEELQKQYKIALEKNSTQAFILKCQIEILKEILEGE